MKIIDWKKFITATLELEKEAFIVHITSLSTKIRVYLTWKDQIVLLIAEKVTISKEHSDFANIFLKMLATELSKCFNINKHEIDLETGKQLLYKPIYSL